MMSLHEETCSDARKLAHEIHNDVMAGEDEIAKAIDAGFRYRETRLFAENARLVRRVNELVDMIAVLKAQVVGLQGRLENQRKK